MKKIVFMLLLLATLVPSCNKGSDITPFNNFTVDKNKYELEKVLILSRHNIRSPLTDQGSDLDKVTNHKWFNWTSKSGELSLKGGILETEFGQYFRKYLQDYNFLDEYWVPTSESDETYYFYANKPQRTRATAQYFSSALLPISNVPIKYKKDEPKKDMDPVFNPCTTFVNDAYIADVKKQVRGAYDFSHLKDNYIKLENILDYSNSISAKTLEHFRTDDIEVVIKKDEEMAMKKGTSLGIANAAAEALELQYYEDVNDKTASFNHNLSINDRKMLGHISDVYEQLLFAMPLVCINAANPMLKELKKELDNSAHKFSYLCGHDSNILSVISSLDFKDFTLPNSLRKTTPIGGKLLIEKWKDKVTNERYYSTTMVYQRFDQLRYMHALDLNNPPMKYPLEFNNLIANSDGLYKANEVEERFVNKINAYDELVKRYQR